MRTFLFFCFVSGFSLGTQAQSWTNLSGPPGGDVIDIEYRTSDSRWYAVVKDGSVYNQLFTSTNDGTSWTRIVPASPNQLQIDDLFVDGTDLFALNSNNLFKSVDNGQNWTRVNALNSFYSMDRILKISSGVYLVYGGSGAYISTNSGLAWTQLLSGQTVYSAAVNAMGDLFLIDSEGIKRHLNPGAGTWATTNITLVRPFGHSFGYMSRLTIDNQNNIYASVYDDVVRSTAVQNGSSWTSVKTGILEANIYNNVSIVASPEGRIFLHNGGANPSKLYATVAPNGTTWAEVTNYPSLVYTSAEPTCVKFISNTKALVGTEGDGIFLTTNAGAATPAGSITWVPATSGINLGTIGDMEVGSSNRVLAVPGSRARGYWFSDNETTWTFKSLPGDIEKIHKTSNGTLIAYGNPTSYRSINNGDTWNTFTVTGAPFYAYATHPSSTITYAWTNTPAFYLSNDNFATNPTLLTLTGTGFPTSYSVNVMSVDHNDGKLYLALYNFGNNQSQIWQITFSGTTGTAVLKTPPGSSNQSFSQLFVSGSAIYAQRQNIIYRSIDGGNSWVSLQLNGNLVNLGSTSTDAAAISTNGGFYVTQDGGKTWTNKALPNGNSAVRDVVKLVSAPATTYYGGGSYSPVLKFADPTSDNLIQPPGSLPTYINFDWVNTDGPYGGYVARVLANTAGTKFYAFTNTYGSYYYKTDNMLASWQPTHALRPDNSLLNADAFEIDPADGTLYALTNNQIFSSADGTSWTLFNNETTILNRQNFYRAKNGDFIMSVWDNEPKIYATTGGSTFGAPKLTLTSNDYIYGITSTTEATSTVYLVSLNFNTNQLELRKSSTPYTTWTLASLPGGIGTSPTGITSDAANNIYISDYTGMYKSANGGTSWSSFQGNLDPNAYYASTPIYEKAGSYYVAVNGGEIRKSADNGATWTLLYDFGSEQITSMNFVSSKIVVTTYNGVFESSDDGATFTPRINGIANLQINDVTFTDQSRLHAFVGNPNRFVTTNGGDTWTALNTPDIRKISKLPNGDWLGYNSEKIFRSANQGSTWTEVATFTPGNLYSIATADGVSFYAITSNRLYFSNNNLQTWTMVPVTGLPASTFFNGLLVDANSQYLIVPGEQAGEELVYQVQFSTANQLTFISNSGGGSYDGTNLYLFDRNGGVWESSNSTSWTKKASPPGAKFVLAARNYFFILGGEGALWLSRDQGQNWQTVGLANSYNGFFTFKDVDVNEYTGYAYASITNSPVRRSAVVVVPDDLTAPLIDSTLPADNATDVSLKPLLTITFDEPVTPQASKTLKIFDSTQPAIPIETIQLTTGLQNGKAFSYTPTVVLEFNKNYFITIDNAGFKDIFGNSHAGILSNSVWNFTTRSAPVVSQLAPSSGSNSISLNTALTITFNESLSGASGKNISIYRSTDPSTPVLSVAANTGIVSGNTLSFTPGSGLQYGITYFVKADPFAFLTQEGVAVSLLTANTDWTFATRVQPVVESTNPASTLTGQMLNTPISITFSEPATGVNGKSLRIFKASDLTNPVVTFDTSTGTISGNTISFTLLPSTLEFNTMYVVKADAGAFALSDGGTISPFQTDTDWTFTTRVVPTVLPGRIPAQDAVGVGLKPIISIEFSESLTPVANKNLNLYKANEASPVVQFNAAGTVDAGKITYLVNTALEFATQYYLRYDDGSFRTIDEATLNLVNNSTDWAFTTKNTPTVQLTPAAAATNVAVALGDVSMMFSEPVNPVSGKKLHLFKAGFTTEIKSVNVTDALKNGSTLIFNFGSSLEYQTSYYLVADAGAFSTEDGGIFSAVTDNNQWTFSTLEAPDSEAPQITFVEGSFTRGATNKLQATITDNKSVSGAKLHYRGIGSAGNFTEALLTLNASVGKWEVTVEESWLDGMGLEYYLTATDPSNNMARLPVGTDYFSSNFTFASPPGFTNGLIQFGGEESDYRIISIPYQLADNKVSTVFNEVNNGNGDKRVWRLLTFGGGTKWKEYPRDFTTISRGVGYWINIRSFADIKIEGASSPQNDRTNLFPLTLHSGWNQIGNPYPVQISWNEIRAQNANIGVLKKWNGSGYQNGDVLEPFEGGFVFLNGSSQLTVDVTFKGVPKGGRSKNHEITSSDLGSSAWFVPLRVTQGLLTHDYAGFGMSEDASLDFDSYDDLNAPRFVRYIDVNFTQMGQKLARNVVPSQSAFDWTFDIESNQSGDATIEWSNTSFGDSSVELYLYDESLQKPVNMREVNAYTFNPRQSGRFRIFYGDNALQRISPHRVTLGNAFPNPSSGKTHIPFTLPERNGLFQVQMEVFDMMGRRVATVLNKELPTGFYQADWEPGELPTDGLYTYRLSVSAGNNSEVLSGKVLMKK
ncbi:MAG: Ig-like domain-containing protein [Bacteroidota bacterium]